MSSVHPWIILFDIDGTLLTVNQKFNRPLIRSIIDELGIDYPGMENDAFSGRTDHDIFNSFLINHDNREELYGRLKQTYLNRLDNELNDGHVTQLSHIEEAINYFSEPEFVPALLTGNYPKAARIKLKAAKIDYTFSFGAFGEHHSDRNELPFLALDEVRKTMGIEPDPSRFIVIGDTPLDIQCARNAGMKAIAVTTGSFSKEKLSEHRPDLLLDNLGNPDQWFDEISSR